MMVSFYVAAVLQFNKNIINTLQIIGRYISNENSNFATSVANFVFSLEMNDIYSSECVKLFPFLF